MISVLIANAKGGCGKTTIATNLATAFANAGLRTALAETDSQRSCLAWIKRRPADAATVELLDWRKTVGAVPKGIERLVIDTRAGLTAGHVRDLARSADLVVMPVVPSVFDERATKRFLKKVDALKPVRKGKKPIAIVGNRMRANTHAARELDAFLDGLGHPVAARFGDRAIYQDVARRGLGIFDLPPSRRQGVVEDWLALVRLVEAPAD